MTHESDGDGRYPQALVDYATRPERLPAGNPVDNDGLDIALTRRLEIYEMLELLRQVGKRSYHLFLQNLVNGPMHLSLGMEGVAAGFGAAMREDDYSFATYRGHAHTLARGVEPSLVLAELLGRSTGLLNGKGGSMHMTSVEHGMMGSYAIIGAHLTIANGAAWSAQIRRTGQVAVCFFGDGTTNIGAFHEALNLAAIWKLPVVFVCENNLYMEYSPIDMMTAVARPAADRAAAYGLAPIVVDGNDADAVFEVATTALEHARSGEGPSLIEAETYRSGGHSKADPAKYRPPGEVAAWADRDAVKIYHERLLRLGVDEGRLKEIVIAVAARVDAATEFAKAGEFPAPHEATTDLWTDGGSAWRN